MELHVDLGRSSYSITIRRGALREAGSLFPLDRTALVVTDDGVPPRYARSVADQCRRGTVETLPQGEGTKSFPFFERLCRACLTAGLTRGDCVVAVGGGALGVTAVGVYAAGVSACALKIAVGVAAASADTAVGKEANAVHTLLWGSGLTREEVEAFLLAHHDGLWRPLVRLLSFFGAHIQ